MRVASEKVTGHGPLPFRKASISFQRASQVQSRRGPCSLQFDNTLDIMVAAKSYRDQKVEWVSGHTGSSVADVNNVSLAMPVPYTPPNFEH